VTKRYTDTMFIIRMHQPLYTQAMHKPLRGARHRVSWSGEEWLN